MAPPASFRAIQPAPVIKGAKSGTPAASSAAHSSKSGWFSAKVLTKRIKAVTQACQTCRKNKAKCDGLRPRCSACIARHASCGYEGEAGQSRQAALRSRLEALEKLVGDLQSKPASEAEELLQRLRSENHISIQSTTHTSAIASPASSSEPSRSTPSVATSPRPSSKASLSPTTSSPSILQQLRPNLAEIWHLGIPNAQVTSLGIQSFFSSCGKLFHIFSREQMEAYHRAVYGIDGPPDTTQKLAICCLSGLAAVGVQYNPSVFEKGIEKVFHDVSRRFFSEVIEEEPLATIKVCTLFAMYNILNKATVALAYVEVGLSMSKRQSQSTGVCHPSMLSEEQWVDFRRTWRALIFFSSWLSSTLGYISGADDSDLEKLLPVAEQEQDSYSAELGELVQAEMTKISLLKAGILRNHLTVQELTALGMDGIIKELQDWHNQLPEPMKLRSLYRDDWGPLVRWSIYHLHLLYSGAFMLVYRRIAAHCVRLIRTRGGTAFTNPEPALLDLVEQGLTSARDTARIVSLLLGEQGVFKRCWIVIFQTHTSCVIILHSIAQKQLHRFPPSSWAEDMKRAQQCLDVLGFCGEVDSIALRFRVRLSGIFNSLVCYVPEGQTPTMQRVADWVPPPPPNHPHNDSGQEPHP